MTRTAALLAFAGPLAAQQKKAEVIHWWTWNSASPSADAFIAKSASALKSAL